MQVAQQEEAELDELLAGMRPKLAELKRLKARVMGAVGVPERRKRCLAFLAAVRDDLDLSEDIRRKLVVRSAPFMPACSYDSHQASVVRALQEDARLVARGCRLHVP